MFCPKCGSALEEGTSVCPSCGLDIATINQSNSPVSPQPETIPRVVYQDESKKTGNIAVKIIYFGLAIVVFIMFFWAAHNIVSGGKEIMQIQSVGGKTLEEAYYYELGTIYAGYAMISRALGVFFAAVLVWLGIKG